MIEEIYNIYLKLLVKHHLTKQYGVTQLAEKEDEELAKEQLITKAKEENMLEWCFLEKKYTFNIEDNKQYVRFGLMANPFYKEKQPDEGNVV